ncbi:MAG: hypothetical protein WCI73_15815 [Phycisphaerae bacterium]
MVETTVNLVEKEVPALDEFEMPPGGRMPMPSGYVVPMQDGTKVSMPLQNPAINVAAGSEASVVMDDGTRRYERQFKDGKNMLKVTEKGLVIFSGPIDTEEQRANVPADILKRIDAMKIQVQKGP